MPFFPLDMGRVCVMLACHSFWITCQPTEKSIVTPRAHARARGYVIGRGVYILYICKKNFELFLYLSKYSLSDIHFKRLLFEFNRLQYTLAAPEVFVSSENPVSLPSGYRVSIIRNTNIDQIETTPLRYCMLHARDTVEHAYSRLAR